MKKNRLFVCFLLFFVFGCSQVPYPISYPFDHQEKMQAAKHWDILAKEISKQVKIACKKIPQLKNKPIYIKPLDNKTPFGSTFHKLLLSNLIKKNLKVSNKTDDSIILEYQTNVIKHGLRHVSDPPVLLSALGLGIIVADGVKTDDLWPLALPAGIIGDGVRGASTGGIPNKEVVITNTLIYNDQIYESWSDLFYINSSDYWHYDTQPFQKKEDGRKYHVVGQ